MKQVTTGQKTQALMATGRIANLPTVWSNVLVGLGIAITFKNNQLESFFQSEYILTYLVMSLAASCLYVGGCMLGDGVDLEFDQKNRPQRPLPAGVLSKRTVTILSYLLLIGGMVIALMSYPLLTYITEPHFTFTGVNTLNFLSIPQVIIALLLTSSIIMYAFYHKKAGKYALFNMALCRFLLASFSSFLLYTAVQISQHGDNSEYSSFYIALVFSLAVGIYTYLLSSVASTESTPEQYRYRKILSISMLMLPLISVFFIEVQKVIFEPTGIIIAVASVTIYTVWSIYGLKALNSSKPTFVSRALAGFCLLDMCFAATLSLSIALICLGLFIFALFLQKFAPAT